MYAHQGGPLFRACWKIEQHLCFNVIDDWFCEWSARALTLLSTRYDAFAHRGRDSVTELPLKVHNPDCSYTNPLQSVRGTQSGLHKYVNWVMTRSVNLHMPRLVWIINMLARIENEVFDFARKWPRFVSSVQLITNHIYPRIWVPTLF